MSAREHRRVPNRRVPVAMGRRKPTFGTPPTTDALYGRMSFPPEIAALILTPVVQRLRHVRLSNIDSLDMPAIANLSRFEHVLGTAHLASRVGVRASAFRSRAPSDGRVGSSS